MTYETKQRLSLFKRKGIFIPLIVLYAFFIGTLIWDCVEYESAYPLVFTIDWVEYAATLLFFLAFALLRNKKYAGLGFMAIGVAAFVSLLVIEIWYGWYFYWHYLCTILHQISIIALTFYQFFLGLYLFKTEFGYIY